MKERAMEAPRRAGMIAALVLFLAAAAHPARASMTWESCGDGAIAVTDVTMSPDPAVAGENIKISIDGSTTAAAASGTVDIGVSYRGVHIYQESDDLCKRTSCPVDVGALIIHADQDLPPFTPPGPYKLQIQASDESGAALLCIAISFDISAPSSAKGKLQMLGGLGKAAIMGKDKGGHEDRIGKFNVRMMRA